MLANRLSIVLLGSVVVICAVRYSARLTIAMSRLFDRSPSMWAAWTRCTPGRATCISWRKVSNSVNHRHWSLLDISDVNRKPKIWYTQKIPIYQIGTWFFCPKFLDIFLVFYRHFEYYLFKTLLNIGIFGQNKNRFGIWFLC